MHKSYSVFVDDMYYYDFIALYNSWKYYGNKIPIKVYSHNTLSLEKKRHISKFCEVIQVSNNKKYGHNFKNKYLFKFKGLVENMSDNEILLDADTIMLSNMDHLFDEIQKGVFLGVSEFDEKIKHGSHCLNPLEWETEYIKVKDLLKKHTGSVSEEYTKSMRHHVYNAGFYGMNKSVHLDVLEKSIEILLDKSTNPKNVIFMTEQYAFSFLMHLLKLPINQLPNSIWMNTWSKHSSPKKIIKVDDGKVALYNETGERVKFYHFTGDIGVFNRKHNSMMSCRPHQIFETQPYEVFFNKKDVYDLWLKKHQNPVILIYEMFANMGMN
jgi:hypothetical protein